MNLFSLAGILLLFIACAAEDDASTVRRIIREGADAAEKHNISDLMQFAASGFTAQPGNYNSKTARGILINTFKYYGNFKIYYPHPLVSIEEGGKKAEATVYSVILRKDYILPDLKDLYNDPEGWIASVGKKADLYELELTFSKAGKHWKVRQARIKTLKGLRS